MLQIVIQQGCEPCIHALLLADRAASTFADVEVDVIDIDRDSERLPADVFAVPSFLIDGHLFSLGNPTWEELAGALAERRHYDGDY